MTFKQLQEQIAQKKFSPIYYLYGEESYFIDKLSRALESSVLEPHEEAFNKIVLYGADAQASKLLGDLRSFPMMATRRLVMLKEAQRIRKPELEKLVTYLENPVDTTVFVIAWKGRGIDGRSKAAKALKAKATSFESKKMYENKVGPWLKEVVESKGLKINPDALQVMVAYLGTNLSLIESEVDKILVNLRHAQNKTITREIVFEMINIDKDFNVFELLNSLGARDHVKSHLIINQMMKNVKDNPPILILFQVFQFFNKLARLKHLRIADEYAAAKELGMNPFIARQYVSALKRYQPRELHKNLVHVLEADLFMKGIRPTHMGQEHIMKTLVYKLLN